MFRNPHIRVTLIGALCGAVYTMIKAHPIPPLSAETLTFLLGSVFGGAIGGALLFSIGFVIYTRMR